MEEEHVILFITALHCCQEIRILKTGLHSMNSEFPYRVYENVFLKVDIPFKSGGAAQRIHPTGAGIL